MIPPLAGLALLPLTSRLVVSSQSTSPPVSHNEEQLIQSILDDKFGQDGLHLLGINFIVKGFYTTNPNVGHLSDFRFCHGVYSERQMQMKWSEYSKLLMIPRKIMGFF